MLQGEVGIEAVPMQSIKSIQEALRMCTALYQELSTQAAQPSLSAGFPGAASAAQANGTVPPPDTLRAMSSILHLNWRCSCVILSDRFQRVDRPDVLRSFAITWSRLLYCLAGSHRAVGGARGVALGY